MKARTAALVLAGVVVLLPASAARALTVSPTLLHPMSARPGQAAFIPVYFGTEDSITDIQPVEGTNYFLSHRHHSYYFFGGIYLLDDGYVLREKVTRVRYDPYRTDKYIPLTPDKITELQQAGVLPNPLPGYSIPFRDYIAGYSLWLFLVLVLAAVCARMLIERLWDWYTAPKP